MEKLTNIDFSDIEPFDTFKSVDENELFRLDSTAKLDELIEEAFKSPAV